MAITDDEPIASQTMSLSQIIDYQGFGPPTRVASGVLDWCYASLGIGCYALLIHADSIMPGGYGWDYDWEYANFLMTIAALASLVVFFAGLTRVLFIGYRRSPMVVLIGVWMSGLLPVLVIFLARRSLQGNFA